MENEELKTTAEDFEIFKTEVYYWVDKLQLREFRYLIIHKDVEEAPDSFGCCKVDMEGRVATIALSVNWGQEGWEKITKYNLCKTAFHEVCEVLTADIEGVAMIDICKSDRMDFNTYRHALIRRLEWALWEPDYKKRHEL